ncbi:hypothetical protein CLOP_g25256 [Closterium sp. NIES-67]|nr:hypothetical protein CLOP_g25256 [Closterium sp. NIES-67]
MHVPVVRAAAVLKPAAALSAAGGVQRGTAQCTAGGSVQGGGSSGAMRRALEEQLAAHRVLLTHSWRHPLPLLCLLARSHVLLPPKAHAQEVAGGTRGEAEGAEGVNRVGADRVSAGRGGDAAREGQGDDAARGGSIAEGFEWSVVGVTLSCSALRLPLLLHLFLGNHAAHHLPPMQQHPGEEDMLRAADPCYVWLLHSHRPPPPALPTVSAQAPLAAAACPPVALVQVAQGVRCNLAWLLSCPPPGAAWPWVAGGRDEHLWGEEQDDSGGSEGRAVGAGLSGGGNGAGSSGEGGTRQGIAGAGRGTLWAGHHLSGVVGCRWVESTRQEQRVCGGNVDAWGDDDMWWWQERQWGEDVWWREESTVRNETSKVSNMMKARVTEKGEEDEEGDEEGEEEVEEEEVEEGEVEEGEEAEEDASVEGHLAAAGGWWEVVPVSPVDEWQQHLWRSLLLALLLHPSSLPALPSHLPLLACLDHLLGRGHVAHSEEGRAGGEGVGEGEEEEGGQWWRNGMGGREVVSAVLGGGRGMWQMRGVRMAVTACPAAAQGVTLPCLVPPSLLSPLDSPHHHLQSPSHHPTPLPPAPALSLALRLHLLLFAPVSPNPLASRSLPPATFPWELPPSFPLACAPHMPPLAALQQLPSLSSLSLSLASLSAQPDACAWLADPWPMASSRAHQPSSAGHPSAFLPMPHSLRHLILAASPFSLFLSLLPLLLARSVSRLSLSAITQHLHALASAAALLARTHTPLLAAASTLLSLLGLSSSRLRLVIAALHLILSSSPLPSPSSLAAVARFLHCYCDSWAGGQQGGVDQPGEMEMVGEEERQARQRRVQEAMQRREQQQQQRDEWALVLALAAEFSLPAPNRLLLRFAHANDWMGLLAQAQAQTWPLHDLLHIVHHHMPHISLRHHLSLALARCATPSSPPPSLLPYNRTPTLFHVLSQAATAPPFPAATCPRVPVQLLRLTRRLHWPLLAVVAAGVQGGAGERHAGGSTGITLFHLACLDSWLHATCAELLAASCHTSCHGHAAPAGTMAAQGDGEREGREEKVWGGGESEEEEGIEEAHAGGVGGRQDWVQGLQQGKRRRVEAQLGWRAERQAEKAGGEQRGAQAAGLRREGGYERGQEVVEARGMGLGGMVSWLCREGWVLPLLRGLHLFLPRCSLLYLLLALQAHWRQHSEEAEACVAEFNVLADREQADAKAAQHLEGHTPGDAMRDLEEVWGAEGAVEEAEAASHDLPPLDNLLSLFSPTLSLRSLALRSSLSPSALLASLASLAVDAAIARSASPHHTLSLLQLLARARLPPPDQRRLQQLQVEAQLLSGASSGPSASPLPSVPMHGSSAAGAMADGGLEQNWRLEGPGGTGSAATGRATRMGEGGGNSHSGGGWMGERVEQSGGVDEEGGVMEDGSTEAVLMTREASGLQARITLTQAQHMVCEWQQLLWEEEEEQALVWEHCHHLFMCHRLPARRAVAFFLGHAASLAAQLAHAPPHAAVAACDGDAEGRGDSRGNGVGVMEGKLDDEEGERVEAETDPLSEGLWSAVRVWGEGEEGQEEEDWSEAGEEEGSGDDEMECAQKRARCVHPILLLALQWKLRAYHLAYLHACRSAAPPHTAPDDSTAPPTATTECELSLSALACRVWEVAALADHSLPSPLHCAPFPGLALPLSSLWHRLARGPACSFLARTARVMAANQDALCAAAAAPLASPPSPSSCFPQPPLPSVWPRGVGDAGSEEGEERVREGVVQVLLERGQVEGARAVCAHVGGGGRDGGGEADVAMVEAAEVIAVHEGMMDEDMHERVMHACHACPMEDGTRRLLFSDQPLEVLTALACLASLPSARLCILRCFARRQAMQLLPHPSAPLSTMSLSALLRALLAEGEAAVPSVQLLLATGLLPGADAVAAVADRIVQVIDSGYSCAASSTWRNGTYRRFTEARGRGRGDGEAVQGAGAGSAAPRSASRQGSASAAHAAAFMSPSFPAVPPPSSSTATPPAAPLPRASSLSSVGAAAGRSLGRSTSGKVMWSDALAASDGTSRLPWDESEVAALLSLLAHHPPLHDLPFALPPLPPTTAPAQSSNCRTRSSRGSSSEAPPSILLPLALLHSLQHLDGANANTQVDVLLLAHYASVAVPLAANETLPRVTEAMVQCAVSLSAPSLVSASLRLLLATTNPRPLCFVLTRLLASGQLAFLLSRLPAAASAARAIRSVFLQATLPAASSTGAMSTVLSLSALAPPLSTATTMCATCARACCAIPTPMPRSSSSTSGRRGSSNISGRCSGGGECLPLEIRIALHTAAWSQGLCDDTKNLVLQQLGPERELAEAHERRAGDYLADWRALQSSRWLHANDDAAVLLLLHAMRALCAAASTWEGLGAGDRASRNVAQAALLGLQVHVGDTLVGLTAAAASVLLQQQHRFFEALVIANAYDLTSPADWSLLLWTHLDRFRPSPEFLDEWAMAVPMPLDMLLDVAERVQHELGGNRAAYGNQLAGAFRHLLWLVPNLDERLQLATVSRAAPAEVDKCLGMLDRVPATSAPLVLRRGHGGAYMPVL